MLLSYAFQSYRASNDETEENTINFPLVQNPPSLNLISLPIPPCHRNIIDAKNHQCSSIWPYKKWSNFTQDWVSKKRSYKNLGLSPKLTKPLSSKAIKIVPRLYTHVGYIFKSILAFWFKNAGYYLIRHLRLYHVSSSFPNSVQYRNTALATENLCHRLTATTCSRLYSLIFFQTASFLRPIWKSWSWSCSQTVLNALIKAIGGFRARCKASQPIKL